MDGIINWIFFESIYGVLIIAGIFFGITTILKNIIPNLPDLTAIVGLIFFVLLFTMQTYPRYKFHKKALETIENLPPYAHVINKSYWGDIVEPATWFKNFIGSVYIVSPDDSISSIGSSNQFKSMLLRFEEDPEITLISTDCESRTKTESHPVDGAWKFKSSDLDAKMNNLDIEVFCETDWKKEIEMMRVEMLKILKKEVQKQKKQNTIENKKGKD